MTYLWCNRSGQPCAPPKSDLLDLSILRSFLTIDKRKLKINVKKGETLGLFIRGGKELGLGIYITRIQPNSPAARAGLLVGDQILKVNGKTFIGITHKDAVVALRSGKRLRVTIDRVGRFPALGDGADSGRQSRSRTPQRTPGNPARSRATSAQSTAARGSNSWQKLSGASKKVLTTQEYREIAHSLNLYINHWITVNTLIYRLLAVIGHDPVKFQVIDSVTSFVVTDDMERFDALVKRRKLHHAKIQEQLALESLPATTIYGSGEARSMGDSNSRGRVPKTVTLKNAPVSINPQGRAPRSRSFTPTRKTTIVERLPPSTSTADRMESSKPKDPWLLDQRELLNQQLEDLFSPPMTFDDDAISLTSSDNQESSDTEADNEIVNQYIRAANSKPSTWSKSSRPVTSQMLSESGIEVQVSGSEHDMPPPPAPLSNIPSPLNAVSGSSPTVQLHRSGAFGSSRNKWWIPTALTRSNLLRRQYNSDDEIVASRSRYHRGGVSMEPDPTCSTVEDPVFSQSTYQSYDELWARAKKVWIPKIRPNLGLRIAGGKGTKQPLPLITKIELYGCAAEASGLRVGTIVLGVDSQSLVDLEHDEIVWKIAKSFRSKQNKLLTLHVVNTA